jgi:Ser/Thr protein kinase RdoA (MazF antagonist)
MVLHPNDNVLAQAANLYGVDPQAISPFRDATNTFYQFNQEGKGRILRLTPAARRDQNVILAETEWLDYLAAHNARVPKVFRSQEGRPVEVLDDGNTLFFAVVFEKLSGNHPEGEQITSDVLRKWGRALGRLHKLSKEYQPANPAIRRPEWSELEVLDFDRHLPSTETLVLTKCRDMLNTLRQLPVDPDGYGLIHADPEPWNFLMQGGEVTFIDFDDSCYHWYVFDVAVAVWEAVLAAGVIDQESFARHVWTQFYRGYRQENKLSAFWLKQIPMFLQLRVMQDYAYTNMTWDLDNLKDWQRYLLNQQRQAIENAAPVLKTTFSENP